MTIEPILSSGKSSSLYEADFYAWAQEQVKLLREGKLSSLDILNLAEEIESLGRQERRELRNRLGILLGHLLKWEFQCSHRSKSWRATIREQRYQILKLLEESPSLQPHLPTALEEAYPSALNLAVCETSLDYVEFPPICPYDLEREVLNSSFFPGEA